LSDRPHRADTVAGTPGALAAVLPFSRIALLLGAVLALAESAVIGGTLVAIAALSSALSVFLGAAAFRSRGQRPQAVRLRVARSSRAVRSPRAATTSGRSSRRARCSLVERLRTYASSSTSAKGRPRPTSRMT
jgi:hypothetical protein